MTREELISLRERIKPLAASIEAAALLAVERAINSARELKLKAGGYFDPLKRVFVASLMENERFHIAYLITEDIERQWNEAASLRGTIDAINERIEGASSAED